MNIKNKSTLFLLEIIKPYKFAYLLMFIGPIFGSFYALLYNYSVKLLIDVISSVKEPRISFSQTIYPIAVFIFGQILHDIAWRLHAIGYLKSMPYIGRDLTIKIENYIYNHSYKFFQDTSSGSIISKIKGISDGMFKISDKLTCTLSSHFMKTLVSGVFLAKANLLIFFLVFAFLIINTPVSIYLYRILSNRKQIASDGWHNIISMIADKINNISVLFSFASKKREIAEIKDYYEKTYINMVKSFLKWDLFSGIILSFIYWFFLIGIFILLIYLKNLGRITIGDISFLIGLSYIFSENLFCLLFEIRDFTSAYADFKSSFSILQEPQEKIDIENSQEIKITKGKIEIKDLCFEYRENNLIFNKLNLKIKAGEKIGLVGHSGSGKSTLTSILLKYFKIKSGDILIDNQSLFTCDSDSLRSQIALIPQEPTMFYRTVRENISYSKPDASQKEIEAVAKAVNIHDTILKMENGYDTLLGEKGTKISGGQKQRIAIARAILKNAPILLLDEATSALDSKTEQEVQKSINNLLEKTNSTVIAIAHRLSTIKNMDRILVMENGLIVEDGNFEELLKIKNGKFKELWDRQTNGLILD